jgi:hypothetical protein
MINQLSGVLAQEPNNTEARFLRARLHPQAGPYLAAINDLRDVISSEARSLRAVSERLLATYELYGLYLGHLNERLLRPLRPERFSEDVKRLLKDGNTAQKHMAQLIEALAQLDYERAGQLASKAPAGHDVRPEDLPDVCMVEADALFHAAEATSWANQGERHDQFLQKANAVLGRGLEANQNHVGLLFLKADTFQGPYAAAPAEGEDDAVVAQRRRIHFEAALTHLRTVVSIGDAETAVAWVVLLTNMERKAQAADRANDALKIPYMSTVRAWLRLQAPLDGVLTGPELDRIGGEFPPAVGVPPDDYNACYVLALIRAAAGRWDDARQASSAARSC